MSTHLDWLQKGIHRGQRYQLCPPSSALHGITGMQRGAGLGSSLDFNAHRAYEQGDDLRLLDWNVYARSDRLVVKQYQEEVTPHLELLLDTSASMDLPDTRKAEALLQLGAMLATAAGQGHLTWRTFQLHDAPLPIADGHADPDLWKGIDFTAASDPGRALASSPLNLRPRSLRILISDCLFATPPEAVLTRICDGAAYVAVIQLLAKQESIAPKPGSYRLIDQESGESQDVLIDAASARAYEDSLGNLRSLWSRACRRVGTHWLELVDEDFLEHGNLPLLEQAGVLQAI